MKPDWDRLMTEFEGHETILISDVDCTALGKPLCETHGVKGFPTLKYGNPEDLEQYSGGRTYADLQKFASELKPKCSPFHKDLCDADERTEIDRLWALSNEDLKAAIGEYEKQVQEAEKTFKQGVNKLQAEYTGLQNQQAEALAEIKKGPLGLMKAVRAMRPPAEKTEPPAATKAAPAEEEAAPAEEEAAPAEEEAAPAEEEAAPAEEEAAPAEEEAAPAEEEAAEEAP